MLMRQKVLSILALLLMAATGAKAETVTWTASDMAGDMEETYLFINFEKGDAAYNTIKGITVTASGGGMGAWQAYYIDMEGGSTKITFTSSVGNIKSIAITAYDIMMRSTSSGWTLSDDYKKLSWSGDASSTVSMTLSEGSVIYHISEIVFTIESSTVNVTGITLDKTEASMIVGGETLTLTATVAPNDAADKTVTWTTSDASVATVTDGVVTAVAAGTATITATATNGTAATSDDKTATCEVTVSTTVTANEGATGEYWATYYNGTTSFTADENTTVYQAAVNSGKTAVVLTEVTGREIPAGKGVVLKSSAATITLTPTTTTTQTLEGNELTGVDAATAAPSNAYCLSKETTGSARGVGFYTYTGTIPAHRAYLVVAGGPSPARGFLGFGDDDNTTGISLPEAVVIENDGPIYDLSGRRIIGQPQKGIYVKNGKKVVIK